MIFDKLLQKACLQLVFRYKVYLPHDSSRVPVFHVCYLAIESFLMSGFIHYLHRALSDEGALYTSCCYGILQYWSYMLEHIHLIQHSKGLCSAKCF